MKKIYIVGNWKLNLTLAENQKLAEDLKQLFMSGNYQTLNSTVGEKIEVVLAPQFPALSFVAEILKNSPIELAAQNSCFETKGAYTGETSPVLLKELGCRYCIIGHSERRHIFKESDEMIGKKFFTLSSLGIIPIFCVGETLEQREQNQLQTVIERQLQPILEKAEILENTPLVIAYEPVWAIGTGLTANQEQVAEVHFFIYSHLAKKVGKSIADKTAILYGGSVKPTNATEILSIDYVNGLLVGGVPYRPNRLISNNKCTLSFVFSNVSGFSKIGWSCLSITVCNWFCSLCSKVSPTQNIGIIPKLDKVKNFLPIISSLSLKICLLSECPIMQ